MLSLNQRLSQQQKLSPQQIQYQKLLQLNNLALEQRIKTELEINPLLEEEMDMSLEQDDKDRNSETDSEKSSDSEEETEVKDSDDEFDLEDYMNDDDYDQDRVNRSSDDDFYTPIAPSRRSIKDYITDQLRMLNLDEDLAILGEEILGNLDEDGYLKRDLADIVNELDMFDHIKIELDKAEELLKKIQKFDPIGIACRSLKECLLVQLQESKADSYYKYLAIKMLEDYYDDFAKRRFDFIKQKMNLTDDSLKETVELIQSLRIPNRAKAESI